MTDSNWIDSGVYFLLIISTAWGLWRGLWSSLFGILALIAALLTAREYGVLMEPSLKPMLGESPLLPALAALLVFLIAFLLLGLFARLLTATLEKYDIGGLNLLGGAAFGALRGGVFAAIFLLLMSALGVPKTQAWKQATTVPMFGEALYTAMRMPAMADYRGWVKFDKQMRPILRDGRKKTTPTAVSKDVAETQKKVQTRQEQHLQVMKELSEYVNIRSANTPDPVYHGEEPFSFALWMNELVCTMQGGQNCSPVQRPDPIVEAAEMADAEAEAEAEQVPKLVKPAPKPVVRIEVKPAQKQ